MNILPIVIFIRRYGSLIRNVCHSWAYMVMCRGIYWINWGHFHITKWFKRLVKKADNQARIEERTDNLACEVSIYDATGRVVAIEHVILSNDECCPNSVLSLDSIWNSHGIPTNETYSVKLDGTEVSFYPCRGDVFLIETNERAILIRAGSSEIETIDIKALKEKTDK